MVLIERCMTRKDAELFISVQISRVSQNMFFSELDVFRIFLRTKDVFDSVHNLELMCYLLLFVMQVANAV